ncbi:PAS domain-containing protein [Algibacter pectinivorans]|uniref:PAS domain S-box-containing protein n=1 Tax=Algibacter pectinivorans TaxID=870482 RepID=A0A1I1MNT7_9FLAO|nr:PAS domain-containing protein [Algibacter pectinivorans]SFC84858.1 PAS domain S-box-containing protein [Algibacter pectinivorans]
MKTILIVDDIYENLYLLRVILEGAGYHIVEANDGKEALEKLPEQTVHLIISDIFMPVMDGYMFCQACKTDEYYKHIPFVFYTSTYTKKRDEDFALKLGADYFLRKPTDSEKILQLVHDILSKDSSQKQPEKKEQYTDQEVLKLYSKRLISKLEQKNSTLEKEILQRQKIEQKLINENAVLDLIANNIPIKEVFNHIIGNYELLHPGFFVSISMLDEDGIHLKLISSPKIPQEYNNAIRWVAIGNKVGSCGTAAFTKKPVIVSDISTNKLWEDYRDIALKHSLKSCWSIPILSENKTVLGTFAIYSNAIKTPSLDDIIELNSAVNLAKIAIVKYNILEEVKKRDASYKLLINQASDAILTFSFDGTIYDFNKATHNILGYTKSEFSKLKLQDILVGEIIENPEKYNQILNGESAIFDKQFISKNGDFIDAEISTKLQEDGKILAIARDITERKKAELKLQESEYNLRQSQIVANIGSYSLDINSGIWKSSLVLDNIFGINESFVRNVENWLDLIHPDDRAGMQNHLETDVIKNHKKFNREYRLIKGDSKEEVWVHGFGELVFGDDGSPLKMIGTIQDITERKKAEVKILESEYNLRLSQKVANIGTYALDLKTQTWESSEILNDILGISKSYEKTIESWNQLIHPDDREKIISYFQDVVLKEEKFTIEHRFVKHDNKKTIWIHVRGELIRDKDGNPIKVIGTNQDITERKAAEAMLLESEYNLRQSQIVGDIGTFAVDLTNNTWKSSEVLDKMLGVKKSFVKTIDSWVDLIYPDEKEGVLSYFEDCIKNNKKFNREYRICKLNNKKEIWTHGVGEVILDSDGNPIKMIGTMQDVTKRKETELKIQESEKSLLEAQKTAKIGSFNLDLKTEIAEASIVFKEIIGVSQKSQITLDFWNTKILHPEDRFAFTEAMNNSIKTGKKLDFEYRIITYNKKQTRWFHILGDTIFNQGEPTNFFGTIQDVNERKEAEIKIKESKKSLLEAQKIAKLGSFNLNIQELKAETSETFNEILEVEPGVNIALDLWKTIVHPEDKSFLKERGLQYQKKGGTLDIEYRIITKKTKEVKWIHSLGEFVAAKGVYTHFQGTIQDITDRKKAELELKAAKAFSDKLIMSMQEGLLIVNLEGQIILVNDALCKILGYSEEELIGLNLPYPFAKTEDLELMLATKDEVAKGMAKSFHLEFVRKNGEKYLVSFLSGNIKNDEGEVIALFATLKDVSEEEKAKRILEDVARKSIQKKKIIMELTSLVGSDFTGSLKKIISLSAGALNVARVGVWKFNEDKTILVCEKLYNLETGTFQEGVNLTYKDNSGYFEALNGNSLLNIEDAFSNKITQGFAGHYLMPLGITSILDVFIQGNHGMYGVICFEHIGEKRRWTLEEEEFATSIASIVSLMVESSERKIAEKNLVQANTELSSANKELNQLREQLEQENVYLRNELALVFNYEEMVYGSEAFSKVLTQVEKVAPTSASVLLLGESGTGKELLARAIHNISIRNKKPLIKINCSAIPRELIESELFGHKKGSFTGAFSDKTGKFELADGGTLFLDEIGELPLDMQPKILRFLQEGEIEVVGGTGSKKLDVRVIAATNRDLKEEIEKKQFREDLYFRLNVFPIKVPPLKDRLDDVPLLVEHFVDKFNKAYDKHIKYIPSDAMDDLMSHNWPGNIRELENLVERAVILSDSETLMLSPVNETTVLKELSKTYCNLTLDEVQRNHIVKTLEKCDWKIHGDDGASKLLDIKPSTLRDRMKKLGVKKPSKK